MGVSVHSVSFFRQLFTNIGGIFGGKSSKLEEKLLDARAEAIKEMQENAVRMGADEVIGVHVEMSEISRGDRDGFIVLNATGTAVKIKGSE